MNRLNITFQTLAASPNEAAIGVLGVALVDPESTVRSLAVDALAKRPEPRSGELLLGHWFSLNSDQTSKLRLSSGQLNGAVTRAIQTNSELVVEAIAAASTLQRVELLPQLVDISETHELTSTRQAALQTVIDLATVLGSQARKGHDVGPVRAAATSRLAKSVHSFPIHRCHGLVDSFLLASTSKDAQLNDILATESVSKTIVLRRLAASELDGVANLVASFVRRSRIQPEIASIIATRSSNNFRSALLDYVGHDPGSAILSHFAEIGRPACCDDNSAIAAALPVDEHAALLRIVAQTTASTERLLRFVVATIRRNEAQTTDAAIDVLGRCSSLDDHLLVKSAIELAGDFDARVTLGDDALLLGDLIDLLSHGQARVVKGVQRILEPLHLDKVISNMSQLDFASRNKLGSILVMIDPSAVESVRDRLRHPILKNRLEGIAAAESLGIVDLLIDSFKHIVNNDHQEARRAAATAMAHASSKETLDLLRDMIALPECSTRDEAIRAFELRTRVVSPALGTDDFFTSTPVTL